MNKDWNITVCLVLGSPYSVLELSLPRDYMRLVRDLEVTGLLKQLGRHQIASSLVVMASCLLSFNKFGHEDIINKDM